jgi:hypothetical protein
MSSIDCEAMSTSISCIPPVFVYLFAYEVIDKISFKIEAETLISQAPVRGRREGSYGRTKG